VALYLYGVGAYRTWAADHPPPRVVAGYSLGIYVALAVTGALDPRDGLRLVLSAGEGVLDAQNGLGHGLLAVNGLEAGRVSDVLDGVLAPESAALTHLNTPTTWLLTGPEDAIPGLCGRAIELGAWTATQSTFPGATHSPFMRPYLDSYFSLLDGLRLEEPRIPLFSCVTAERVSDAGAVRALLRDQLIRPVRFFETIEKIRGYDPDRHVVVGTCQGIPALLSFLEPDVEVRLFPGEQQGGER